MQKLGSQAVSLPTALLTVLLLGVWEMWSRVHVFGHLFNYLTLQTMSFYMTSFHFFPQKVLAYKPLFFINSKNRLMCQLTVLYQPSWIIPSGTPSLLLNWKKKMGEMKRGCALLLVTRLFSPVWHLSPRQINFSFISAFCFLCTWLWSDFISAWAVKFQAIYLKHVLKVPCIFWNGVFQINPYNQKWTRFLKDFILIK